MIEGFVSTLKCCERIAYVVKSGTIRLPFAIIAKSQPAYYRLLAALAIGILLSLALPGSLVAAPLPAVAQSPHGLSLTAQDVQTARVDYRGNSVRLILADGTAQAIATDDPSRLDPLYATYGTVSPGGTSVLYITADSGDYRNATFSVVNLRTLQKHVIAHLGNAYWVHTPRWSPDSQRVAYVLQNAASGAPELWVIDATGAHQHLVYAGPNLTHRSLEGYAKFAPDWSSDGKSLVFYDSAFKPTTRWVVSLSTSGASSSNMVTPYSCIGCGGGGPLCKLPYYNQHDYHWANVVMQWGGDTIGSAGCALTALTDLFDYYGSTVGDPGGMANCLNPWQYADPVNWQGAQVNSPGGPGCDHYTTNFISSQGFNWSTVDSYLRAGHPVIVEVCLNGCDIPTGGHTHWFTIVSGDGSGTMNGYLINDPDDGGLDYMNKYASWTLNWMVLYQPASGSWPACE